MAMTHPDVQTTGRRLRLWPGVVAAALQWIGWLVVPIVAPQWAIVGMIGGFSLGLVILLWWLFFSRASWPERVGALVVMVAAVAATSFLVHPSIAGGHMGMTLYLYSIPNLSLALVVWAAATRNFATRARRASMVAALAIAAGSLALVRSDGVRGEGESEFHWRWTPTAEERLLAETKDEPLVAVTPHTLVAAAPPVAAAPTEVPPPAAPDAGAAATSESRADASATAESSAPGPEVAPLSKPLSHRAAWPGFRGPRRDGVVRGLQIETDWSQNPPVELWRKPIGPAWSSFAVDGDLIVTQEQRGDDELVSAYNLKTGAPVWRHRDAIRFYESNAGPGPRGTPTVHDGHVYALGATGMLNALNATNGTRIWSRNAATDAGVAVPDWGIASSPLVYDELVVVAISGQLVAYDRHTGERRWLGPKGGSGYSSPHLVTIDGVDQIVLLRGSRTISVAPADGTLLWEHTWQAGVGIVQPALTADGDLLITVGDAMGGLGMRRLAVTRGAGGWTTEERWTSRGLKPYFNDFVVHEGHAYGFDNSILSSISVVDGNRSWKGGRYGHGQMVLLPEQDLLLVLSEDGEVVLVSATADKFTEITRAPALNGKAWNHPVVVDDVLLIRNGQEMAAFRLPRAKQLTTSAPSR